MTMDKFLPLVTSNHETHHVRSITADWEES